MKLIHKIDLEKTKYFPIFFYVSRNFLSPITKQNSASYNVNSFD